MKVLGILMCIVLAGCGEVVGPEKPLGIQIAITNPDGTPRAETDLAAVRLYRSRSVTEIKPDNMLPMESSTISPNGLDENGEPLVIKWRDIDQSDMVEGVPYYFYVTLVNDANNESPVSEPAEETRRKTTAPGALGAPRVLEGE